MSDLIENKVEDLYLEHSQHNDEWLKNCSLCYEDKINTYAKYKKMSASNIRSNELQEAIDWDLQNERSVHPEEGYWGN